MCSSILVLFISPLASNKFLYNLEINDLTMEICLCTYIVNIESI